MGRSSLRSLRAPSRHVYRLSYGHDWLCNHLLVNASRSVYRGPIRSGNGNSCCDYWGPNIHSRNRSSALEVSFSFLLTYTMQFVTFYHQRPSYLPVQYRMEWWCHTCSGDHSWHLSHDFRLVLAYPTHYTGFSRHSGRPHCMVLA